MAYTFDGVTPEQKPRGTTRSAAPQGGGQLPVERRLIYGEDIRTNPVPASQPPKPGQLHLGFSDPTGRAFCMDEGMLSKHLLLLGGIGSGKTNVFNFIVESLLQQQKPEDIIFIFDTKGDFQQRFYRSYDPNHILIGNGDKYAARTRHWNVFGELESGDGRFTSSDSFTAKEIGKQLFEGRGSETQPFFSLAAADLVSKVLVDFERQAAADGDRSRLTNQALTAWFKRADLRAYQEMISRNPDFASAQLFFGDPGQGAQQKLTAQALGVFGYINAMLNDLFTGIFEEPRPGGPFSMRRLVRERGKNGGRTVVFIEYDLSVGEVLGPMYRLLIDLALKEALGQEGNRRGNVIFVIDEFKLLPDLMHIDDALNFGRSLGVKVFAGVQSIDQIYAGYGEERGRAMLSGFMNCFCFQTPDYHSRQYVSERFGENCTHLLYRALDEPMSYQREGHTIEDWEIRALAIGQAAIDLVGKKPFLFQFENFEKPHRVL